MYPSSGPADNTYHLNSDYPHDHEARKFQQQPRPEALANNFRPSVSSFLSSARPRHPPSRPVPSTQYRDTASFYSQTEAFTSSVTSPIQPHAPHFESRPSYDFAAHAPPNGMSGAPKSFGDVYTPSPVAQSHQPNGNKTQHSQPAQQVQYPGPFANGPQMSSQTPYGPHVLNQNVASSGVGGASTIQPPALGPGSTNTSNTNSQTNTEEISTIFVVGFPDDMQEREFQNMFTFSPDFEAATLKIPNKDYTTHSNISGGLRNGPVFTGPNDPYNLVTVNQGGVIVDTGRDGTVTSWSAFSGDDFSAAHFTAAAAGLGAPRKQIIGFAKFRTREAALLARDGLQGRRVDIDKGAVLKAEMAKKNLHTKRGVGPVTGPLNGTGGPIPPGMNQGFMSPPSNSLSYNNAVVDALGARDRDIGPLSAMGLGGRLNSWRDQLPQQDHLLPGPVNGVLLPDRTEDDRRATLMNAMGLTSLGSITRGPRERAEDEERERRRKEKDAMRLRVGNPSAFEAFHSVPPGISRHLSSNGTTGLVSPENDAGMVNPLSHPGPWDGMRLMRPRSPSRSSSPSKGGSSMSEYSAQPFSPSIVPPHFQFYPQSRDDHRPFDHLIPDSAFSSSQGLSNGADGYKVEADLPRALNGLDMDTNTGKTSPDLPSPASGASSRNGIDQNPPINTLYVGNLPTSSSAIGLLQDQLEASLRELFQSRPGYRRLCFRQKPNGPMCFVEFEDVAHATKALNDLYGNTLKGLVKGGIRLSYSKNPLGVRTPTGTSSNNSLQQQQQQQSGNFNAANTFPLPQEHHMKQHNEQQSRLVPIRRETAASTSPLPPGQSFMTDFTASSPSPRFSISPQTQNSSMASAPVAGSPNAFIPRYGYNVSPGAHSSTFAPFSLASTPPPHLTIPDQQSLPGDHSPSHHQHIVHTFTPANNLEAARAG